MDKRQESYEVNLFNPKQGYMRGEVVLILAILVGWGVVNFGFQAVLWLLAENPLGEGIFTRLTFFNLPYHFWFTAQFLPLWFIILCVIFNICLDRLTERHSRRRDRTYE